jgi:hypothetical protein
MLDVLENVAAASAVPAAAARKVLLRERWTGEASVMAMLHSGCLDASLGRGGKCDPRTRATTLSLLRTFRAARTSVKFNF